MYRHSEGLLKYLDRLDLVINIIQTITERWYQELVSYLYFIHHYFQCLDVGSFTYVRILYVEMCCTVPQIPWVEFLGMEPLNLV